MPLYRVESDGSLTQLLLGVVTPEGPDFGSGAVDLSIYVRLHEATVLALAVIVEPEPVHVRVHETHVHAIPVPVYVRMYEADVVGAPV